MKITMIKYYGGAQDKVCRLGISHLFLELQQIIFNTDVYVQEKKDANGAAVIREKLDDSFESAGEWEKNVVGDIDWVKRIRYNNSIISRMVWKSKSLPGVTCSSGISCILEINCSRGL